MQRWSAAHQMVAAYRMPEQNGGEDLASVFIGRAAEHHPHWLNGRRHPGWLPFDEFHWAIPQDAYPHSDD
jgi:hypothetical protein